VEKYIQQLLSDISNVTEEARLQESQFDIWDWIPEEEEEKTAPIRNLEELTGIKQEMLPSSELMTEEQVAKLLAALIKMLEACNWYFVMQVAVPEQIQYETIRQNFDQEVKVKQWHMGFFEYCKPGTEFRKCTLGEYCHCELFDELFKHMVDEDLTDEEERARFLDIEIQHIKRKYGDDWMKYYPYHLDPDYDDEDGNPYDYGLGDFDDDEDYDNDDWWRK
jgi:hypothetical protein